MTSHPPALAGNLARFRGLAETYAAHRPRPPAVLVDILTQLAQIQRPTLVVDLGSGTGLSTFLWADHADAIIGIEPNDDMRRVAEAQLHTPPAAPHIRFQASTATQTDLPDNSADIITCAQALHWMEPTATFAEILRILRPGGVFAAYDYAWPPTMHWEAEEALMAFMTRSHAMEDARGHYDQLQQWHKDEHYPWMKASGLFRAVKNFHIHHVETGNADRLIGLAHSSGGIGALLQAGVSETELGLDQLRHIADRTLGPHPNPWYWSYTVRLGVK